MPEHRNGEVEVLIVALLRAGFVEIDGRHPHLAPGQAQLLGQGGLTALGLAG